MSATLQSNTVKHLTRRRAVTFACMMAIFMAAVEATIVATAMPTIVGQLGAFHLFSWVFAAYLLAQAVSTPVYGRLADLYGRKRMFVSGATLFLLASTACGFTWALGSWGMASLVLFRTIQGFGAGSLQSMATTIVGDIYPPTDRAKVQGWLSGTWGLAALAGPVLGAFIVQHVHWAFVFWINLPIGIAAILIMASSLHERIEIRPHHVDIAGSILLMIGVGGVLMTIVQAQNLSVPLAATLFGVGVLALLLLILHERRAKEPIVPFQLWRQRIVAECSVGGLTIGMLLMCVVAFLPTLSRPAMGRSVTFGGTAIAIQSVSWSISAIIAARLMGLLVLQNRRAYRLGHADKRHGASSLRLIATELSCGSAQPHCWSASAWVSAIRHFCCRCRVVFIGISVASPRLRFYLRANRPNPRRIHRRRHAQFRRGAASARRWRCARAIA